MRTSTPSVEGVASLRSPKQAIPGFENEALGAAFAEFLELIFLEQAQGFTGVVGAHQIGGVKDVAHLITGEAVEMGVVNIHAHGRAAKQVADLQVKSPVVLIER